MVLGEKNFLVKVKDLIWEVVIAVLVALVQLCGLDLEGVRDSFDILHIVKLDLCVHVVYLWVEVQVSRLAIEVVFLNDMHCVVVPASQDIHVVRVFAVFTRPVRRHLQVKAVEDTLSIVGSLQLYVWVQIVLHSQILYEVLRLPQIPHLNVEVVATSK